jgi:putative membrane protein
MALTWVVVIGVVVWAVARITARDGARGRADPDGARRILDERFARGEIDEDEYRARRATLTPTPGGRP